MKNKFQLNALVFFLPELLLIAFSLLAPARLIELMIKTGEWLFTYCYVCTESKLFLVSSMLLILCLFFHCMRLLILHLLGNPFLIEHRFSLKELFFPILILFGYAVFLWELLKKWKSTTTSQLTDGTISIGILDVIGASATAASLLVVVIVIVSRFFPNSHLITQEK